MVAVLQSLFLEQHASSDPKIPYFKWICDPFSFPRTVENMFHTSFMLKESLASLYVLEDELFIGEATPDDDDDPPSL